MAADPSAPSRWDFVVVGGGPAGMSAALLASLNGLRTLLLERSPRLGGQVRWADAPIPDLLGAPASGNELADRFSAHLRSSPAEVRTGTGVAAIRWSADELRLTVDSGVELTARRVLLATGQRPRKLGVPGEERADRVAHPRRELGRFRGRPAAVVGGGDEASSLARDLADAGADVTLLVRNKLRARPLFGEPVRRHPKVAIREGAVVSELAGGPGTVNVVLTTGECLEVDFCFVRIGVEVALPAIEPPPALRDDGRVRVDEALRTSCPGLFAAGDLVRPHDQKYVAAALADGTLVARKVEADLFAR